MNRLATTALAQSVTGSRLLLCFLGLSLAGCGDNQFAYLDNGGGQSLSVVREQKYLMGPWKSILVSAATPRCQKRHALEGMAEGDFLLKVYRPEQGVFILNAGPRWFVTELQNCEFQAYRTPPPFPGEAVGRFEVRNKSLEFIAEKPAKR